MNKYVVELKGDTPICTVTSSHRATYTMEGIELIQFLGRIDESIYGRKVRTNPLYDKKEVGNTLFYINKLHNKNIRIKNYKELIDPLKDLYRMNKKQVRKNLDKPKKIIKGAAATGVMIGGIALASMGKSANKDVDLEKVGTYNQLTIEEISTEELNSIIELPELKEEVAYEEDIEVNDEIELDNNEIESIIATTNIDVEAVYDQGINDRVDPYMDDIIARANKWGVSPELMYDIISQEYGGNNTNLTHVIFDSWKDQVLTVHNYEDNKDEKIVLTENPSLYQGKADQIITREELTNPKTNISMGAIILQYSIKAFDYNIPLGIQAYNNGVGGVENIINETIKQTGVSREELIYDMDGTSWIPYTYAINKGDEDYLKNVVKHIDQDQLEDKINGPYSILYMEDGQVKNEAVQFKLK